MKTDTIAAIATAMSSSGIGIVRISGEEAVLVADRIFEMKNHKKLSEMPTHSIHYGHIHDEDEVIDEVMVLLMRGPKSYTREDTVEIDCHGGVYVMKRILETVIRHGARPAEPGEFTKRAFLNGRIDLSQAESVIDVIYSKNDFALKSSLSQLSGSVSEKIRDIRGTVLHEIAFIESALDESGPARNSRAFVMVALIFSRFFTMPSKCISRSTSSSVIRATFPASKLQKALR